MRVLYLCHRIPYPPDKGDKIRAFHHLRAIASRHEVDLFTLADDAADLRHRSKLLDYCGQVTVAQLDRRRARFRALPYLFTSKPLTLPYFYSSELEQEIRLAWRRQSYDRVFVYCSAMAQYSGAMPAAPTIVDFVDMDSDKWTQYSTFTRWPLSAVYRREGLALLEYERQVAERSSCIILTTEREARLARQITGTPVHVIANGVDSEFFQPSGTMPSDPTIGFTGDMSYFPNQEAVTFFARAVLPLIRKSVPKARFLIVGRNPSRGVQKLAEIEGIEVTGFVPDVRALLARMQVSVAPFSIAAGIQNKILEAMAYGVPVVATSKAVRGLLEYTAGAVEIADQVEEMAAKVVRLLREPELARSKGSEGRRRVTAEYRWDLSADRLLQVVEEPLAGVAISRAAVHTPLGAQRPPS
jgi:sugar transferase (PEP-CTERM/EpsH1 system associated)